MSLGVCPGCEGISVTVNENQRVFTLLKFGAKHHSIYKVKQCTEKVHGQFVKSFSLIPDEILATFIPSASDNRFMVLGTDEHNDWLIHVFDAEGRLLKLIRGDFLSVVVIGVMAFHISTERIIIPSMNNDGNVMFSISTEDGKLVHAVHLSENRKDSLCIRYNSRDFKI